MKTKTIYKCAECGYESLKWMGRCSECGAWNSFEEASSSFNKKEKSNGVKKDFPPPGGEVNIVTESFTIPPPITLSNSCMPVKIL